MPAHKTAGDGLTAAQEYRGFILDAGGFDWDGRNGHPGRHKRLSPAFKELLVEVDSMSGIRNPPPGGIHNVLQLSSQGFSNKIDGGAVRMYWVLDEGNLLSTNFAADGAVQGYLAEHRNVILSPAFVHLLFGADAPEEFSSTGGFSYGGSPNKNQDGSVVLIDRRAAWLATPPAYPVTIFDFSLAKATTHELVHLLLLSPQNVPGQTQWDNEEHEKDPNDNKVEGDPGDDPFLMYRHNTLANNTQIKFSNPTRQELNLRQKNGVTG